MAGDISDEAAMPGRSDQAKSDNKLSITTENIS